MYPNHCNTNCPTPCPPPTAVCPPQVAAPPCPPPPKNWCIPGERGPRGEQGPRGYTGADGTNGKSANVKCCRFTGGNFTTCITTLTPSSGVDRQALEALIVEMKAAKCVDGFVIMTKVEGALAQFCYVCDGKGGVAATAKPSPQYRSGVFSYGTKSAFGVDFNAITTGIEAAGASTPNNPTAFVHRGYLAPGNADLLSNEPVYSIVPYKNGANLKAYSWNWTGTPGMSIYFNFVAFKCDSSGAQYAEVYGPKVQGVNNTSKKLTGNSQTYYVIGSRCGCQEVDFKMPCGSNLAIYIRDIRRTNTVTPNAAGSASFVSDSLNCVVPTDIKSMVVCDLVLENLAYLNCEGAPEYVLTRSATAGSFDANVPYVTLNYATSTAATHDTWQGTTTTAKDCLEFVEMHPFIEYVSKSTTKDVYYLLATARRVQYYTNTDIPSNHNKMYKLLITQEVDKGTAPTFFAWASTTSSIIPSATNKIKITASSRVYAYPMNDMVTSSLPLPGVLPTRTAGQGGRNDVARFMNNLTMSLEFCQLDDANKLPFQVSTVAPATLPLTSKKAWPELRSTTNKLRTVNEVAEIIKKERSDLSLTFKYIKNGETYTQPSSTTVIIFTSGDADSVSGYAIVSYTHAPILG